MYKFLDNITIITKDGTEYKIDEPLFYDYSISSAPNTLVSRGVLSNNCYAEYPMLDYDAVNKKYVLDEHNKIASKITELNRSAVVNKYVLKEPGATQSINSQVEYKGPVSVDSNIVNKQYVDEYGTVSFTLTNVPANTQFPRFDWSMDYSLIEDWGDGTFDYLFSKKHTYENSGTYNGHFYFTTDIGLNTFKDYIYLTKISIPTSVTSFNFGVLENTGLVELTIPFVGENCSTHNDKLGYIFGTYDNGNIPSSLKTVRVLNGCVNIKHDAFNGCQYIENIYLSDAIANIENNAFYNCNNLQKIVVYNPAPPTLSESALEGISPGVGFYVPDESVEIYKTASGWSDHQSNIYPISDLST